MSEGKRLGEEKRHVKNRVAQALRLAAATVQNSQTALGGYYHRMRARIGSGKAVKATAHKLARILYRLLRYGTAYVETGQLAYEEQYRHRQVRSLQRKTADLGFTLLPAPTGAPVS